MTDEDNEDPILVDLLAYKDRLYIEVDDVSVIAAEELARTKAEFSEDEEYMNGFVAGVASIMSALYEACGNSSEENRVTTVKAAKRGSSVEDL